MPSAKVHRVRTRSAAERPHEWGYTADDRDDHRWSRAEPPTNGVIPLFRFPESGLESQTPLPRAIGHTFEFTLSLPEPSNTGGRPPNWNKPTVKTSRKATPKARKPKARVEPTPEQVEAKKEVRQAYDRKRAQTPERRALQSRIAQEKRNEARSLEVWPESHWPGFALRQTDVL